MEQKEEYAALMTEIIGKQAVILGPDIAIMKAKNIGELAISGDGKVTDIQGDPGTALGKLVDAYVELSGQIVKNTLSSVFTKYPSIKVS
ncbi:MAG: hypothetical protein HYV77_01910 [Candidatus Wildermuthbacteria bacterium]|nr:hypothetical protein [Candidatus Wildermuthbacteria bacterium]